MLKIVTKSVIDFKDTEDPVLEQHEIKKYFFGWNYNTIINSAEKVNFKDEDGKTKSIGFGG